MDNERQKANIMKAIMLKDNKLSMNLPSMLVELLIFDFDGVLVDTQAVANKIQYRYLTENFPLEISFEGFVKRFSGLQVETIIGILEREQNITFSQTPQSISRLIDEKVLKQLSNEPISPLPGVVEFLQSSPLPKCIGSNCSSPLLKEFLEASNLSRFFGDNVFNAEMVTHPKPAPDLYLYAAQRMNCNKEDCLVIEDSVVGVSAAVQAGISVIGFLAGSHVSPDTENELLQAGAKTIINDMRDLSLLIT